MRSPARPAAGRRARLSVNTDTDTPMNTCGNPVGGGGVVTGSQCRNRQNDVAVGHAG